MAFCKGCYFKLPRTNKNALWNRFGNGFEDAFQKGLAFLKGGQEKLFQ